MKNIPIKEELLLNKLKAMNAGSLKLSEKEERKFMRSILSTPAMTASWFNAEQKLRKTKMKGMTNVMKNAKKEFADEPILQLITWAFAKTDLVTMKNEKHIVDMIEGVALNQIELRKDLMKLTKLVGSTKNKSRQFNALYKKIQSAGNSTKGDISNYKKYLRIIKDEIDLEAKDTTKL